MSVQANNLQTTHYFRSHNHGDLAKSQSSTPLNLTLLNLILRISNSLIKAQSRTYHGSLNIRKLLLNQVCILVKLCQGSKILLCVLLFFHYFLYLYTTERPHFNQIFDRSLCCKQATGRHSTKQMIKKQISVIPIRIKLKIRRLIIYF